MSVCLSGRVMLIGIVVAAVVITVFKEFVEV